MPTKPSITTSHTRTAFLKLGENEIKQLLAEAVASQAGIHLGGQGVTYRVTISSRNSSEGSEKYAEVSITEDLSLQPRPATE